MVDFKTNLLACPCVWLAYCIGLVTDAGRENRHPAQIFESTHASQIGTIMVNRKGQSTFQSENILEPFPSLTNRLSKFEFSIILKFKILIPESKHPLYRACGSTNRRVKPIRMPVVDVEGAERCISS